MEGSEQNRVSQAVWRWRQADLKQAADPAKSRRTRAVTQFLVMAAVSAVLYLAYRFSWISWLHSPVPSAIVICLAGFVLVSGLFVPPLFEGFERLIKAFVRIVGVAMTWGLLVPFFYIVFVPARFFLMLRGKDPMCREFPTSQATYWIPREPRKPAESYRKQF